MLNILLVAYFLGTPIFKSFFYRARGSKHSWCGTQVSRILFWALPYALDGAIFAFLLDLDTLHIGIMALVSFFTGWLAAVVNHANWQSPGNYNFGIMGLITTGMLTIMLLPFVWYAWWFVAFFPVGILGVFAGWFGYSKFMQKYTLELGGVTWCVPGDSSWEEFFIGAFPFGVAISAIGLKLVWGL